MSGSNSARSYTATIMPEWSVSPSKCTVPERLPLGVDVGEEQEVNNVKRKKVKSKK